MIQRSIYLLVLALLGSAVQAQFTTIDAPTRVLAGFSDGLLIEDDGSSLLAYSSVTKEWTVLGPSGTTVVERGSQVACVQRPNGMHAFFLARTGEVLTPVDPVQPIVLGSQRGAKGEIGYICYQLPSGAWRLFACCAKGAGTWDLPDAGLTYEPLLVDSALAVRQPLGANQWNLVGFSARTGSFEESATFADFGSSMLPVVEVNYAGYETPVGTFLFSAPLSTWTAFDAVDQSWEEGSLYVARMDEASGSSSFGSYSPYTATFEVGLSVAQNETAFLAVHRDHVACVRVDGATYHAIGAYPHQAWKSITLPNVNLRLGQDCFALVDFANDAVYGFSGLVDSGFVAQALPGLGSGPPAAAWGMIPLRYGDKLTVFDGLRGEWTPPIDLAAGQVSAVWAGESVLVALVETNVVRCFSLLRGEWSSTIDLGPSFAVMARGSTALLHRPSASLVTAYDSRGNRFVSQALSPQGSIDASGSLGTASHQDEYFVFSQLTSQWEQVVDGGQPVSGVGSTSTLGASVLGVHSNGRLTAFGAPGEHHVWYDYPEERQLNRASLPGSVQPLLADTTLRAPVGSIVFHYYGFSRLTAGLPLGGSITGTLFLPAPIALDVVTQVAPVQQFPIALPELAPAYYQAWLQSAIFTSGATPSIRLTGASQSLTVF